MGRSGAVASFPLPHDEGKPGQLRDAASTARTQFTALMDVSRDVRTLSRQGAANLQGLLSTQAASSPMPAIEGARALAAAALQFSGICTMYASEIDRYNRVVDQLNEEYRAARQRDFGVAMGVCQADETTAERNQRHDAAVDAADLALRARLAAREQAAQQVLDEAGQSAAADLKAGPSPETLLPLAGAGHLKVDDVIAAVGAKAVEANRMRGYVSMLRSAVYKKLNYKQLRALAEWTRLLQNSSVEDGVELRRAMLMREYVKTINAIDVPIQARLVLFKQQKAIAALGAVERRKLALGQNLWKSWKPGGFFSSGGYIDTKILARSKALTGVNSVAGKALGPLGLAGGIYTVADTIVNRDEKTTEQKVTGVVGGGASIISGGLATAALMTSAAFPPALVAVGLTAGAVALGTAIYQNRKAIGNFAKDSYGSVKNGVGSGLKKIGGWFS